MFVIENTVISDDLAEREFVCNLKRCKGACCVEGDLGAPLLPEELPILERVYPLMAHLLPPEGQAEIARQGLHILDWEQDLSTPTINGRECAYGFYEKSGPNKGTFKCGFELAYEQGLTDWPKPLSCHLYPVRITAYDHYKALNYHHWHICADACTLGRELAVPVYKFLRRPLERAFGEAWWQELDRQVEARNKGTRQQPE